jgi:UDP-glucose 4-epimerase
MNGCVLVTGGAGYIGGVVAARLLARGNEVVVLDDLSNSCKAAVEPDAKFVHGNIGDRALLDRIFEENRIVAVMHFAAFIEAGESMKRPEKYFRNNAMNSLTLTEALLAHGVRNLVFSSTAALYGTPERTPIEETDLLLPINAYGESKLLVERMLDWMSRVHGLRYACLRYFNAAGATGGRGEDHHPESHLIPLILEVALGSRECITVFGTDYPTADGTCVRDYVHVGDLASAHLLALDALEEKQKLVYNVGNGTGFSVREVIETARNVTGSSIPVREAARRAGDPAVLVANAAKIKTELGWTPEHSALESIIRSAFEWRLAHPDGYPSRRHPDHETR